MSDSQPCPECNGIYAYPLDALFICPECGHEWNAQEEPQGLVVIDV
ncbi:alkylphosphonate utilization protein, partial [Schleiferiaceae bacterium]|nr:alkylphosphonate utilization protein [Schleiferiaceae bacterium]